jgi:deoxyhypusine synthase
MNKQKLKIIYNHSLWIQDKLQNIHNMTDFAADCIDCQVYYKPGLFDHDVERLENIHHKIRRYKDSDHYIKGFIDHIKHNVIKKFPNLSLIEIGICVFDKNNIFHRLMVTVVNMMWEILKIKDKFDTKNTVFVMVAYENKIVFTGTLEL